MITAAQLKAYIRKLSNNLNINSQILLRNYFHEKFLERVSLSEHRLNFILKGGTLIAAIVGINSRSTVDIDATIKNWPININSFEKMFNNILSIELNDNVRMSLINIENIRNNAKYHGLKVSIESEFEMIKQIIKIDVTTGEHITPREVDYQLPSLFNDNEICLMAYNIETILAEKYETVISRSTLNTRMRDFL